MLTLPSSSRRVLRVCSSHYHVLLWIRDAPVIGVDDPEKVLGWIQEKIVTFLTKNPILNYIRWLLDTKCTNAVPIANENSSAAEAHSLPGVGLDFLAKHVKIQNLIPCKIASRHGIEYTN